MLHCHARQQAGWVSAMQRASGLQQVMTCCCAVGVAQSWLRMSRHGGPWEMLG